MRRWPVGSRKTIYLGMVVIGACGFVMMIYGLRIWSEYAEQTPGHPAGFGDFFALWSYGRIAAEHPAAVLYDSDALNALQVGLGMRAGAQNPFPYPPIAILLFRPLAMLPYEAAYVVWTVGTLALFVGAVVATCSRLAICVAGVIVAPVTIGCISAGQTGLLSATLLISGVRLAGSRPVLGGVLIGLLAYKPQMAVLAPVAFVAAGYWRALVAAGVTAAVLAAMATAVYGAGAWPAWLAMLPGYADAFDRDLVRISFKPTIMANLQSVGVSLTDAKALQGLAALVIVGFVWRVFRRDAGRLAATSLLAGAPLVTPHAFIYDLPMVAAAIALLIQERVKTEKVFSLGEIAVMVLGYVFPIIMLLKLEHPVPVSAAALILLFDLIVRRASQARPISRGVSPASSS